MGGYMNKISGEIERLKQEIVMLKEEARAADRLLEKRERWWAEKAELLDAENTVLREADNACPCPLLEQAESDLAALKKEVEELKEFRNTRDIVAEIVKTSAYSGADIRGLFVDITRFKKSQKEIADFETVEAALEEARGAYSIGELMTQLGENFRSLWVSYMVEEDGTVSHGWSVTVSRDTRMVETTYYSTPAEALNAARKILDRKVGE